MYDGGHVLGLPLLGDLLARRPSRRGTSRRLRLREIGDAVLLVVDRDRHDLEAVRLVLHVELLELRERLLAGLAPGRPEVDDRDLARRRWSSCRAPFIESSANCGSLVAELDALAVAAAAGRLFGRGSCASGLRARSRRGQRPRRARGTNEARGANARGDSQTNTRKLSCAWPRVYSELAIRRSCRPRRVTLELGLSAF